MSSPYSTTINKRSIFIYPKYTLTETGVVIRLFTICSRQGKGIDYKNCTSKNVIDKKLYAIMIKLPVTLLGY